MNNREEQWALFGRSKRHKSLARRGLSSKRIRTLIPVIGLLALSAARADAQSPPVPLDTLNLRNDLHEAVMALAADTVVSFCAPQFRRDRARVFIDWWNPTADATNPLCGPREAHVLIRPSCVFTLAEFLQLRVRALYVVIICRPRAFGIPLGHMPPLERITEGSP